MKKTIFLCMIIAVIIGSCTQRESKLPTVKPEKVGLSSDRLNRIKPAMQRYVDENKLPGLITMVARKGKIVHFEKYGMMDEDKPMQLDAIFSIQSMTKMITSVAVMMLYEEGYFQLDDPISKFIPEFKDLKVFSYKDKNGIHVVDQIKPMTIENLLTHTSGIANFGGNNPVDSMYRAANLLAGTLKDMIQKLSKIPLIYQPGTKWNYSRSTEVLGYLVEVISGKPFDVFLKERIFIPLKMVDTDFSVPKEKINRVAAVYGPADSTGIKVRIKPDTSWMCRPAKFFSGNRGLVSTATDYMIFAQMLMNKGEYNGVRLLGSRTVDFMVQNHISDEIMPTDRYFGPIFSGAGFGLGPGVTQDVSKAFIFGSAGAYWWGGAYSTMFQIDPKEQLILILMTHVTPENSYPFREFAVLTYQAIVD